MADREFDAAYRDLMKAVRSDAVRRRNTVQGYTPNEPSPENRAGVAEAAMMFGGPVLGRAAAMAPRALGAATGLGLFDIGTANEAEAQSRKGGSLPVDPSDQAAAEKLPEHLRPQYLDLASRNRARQLNRAEREQFSAMNRILTESAGAADAAAQKQQAEELTRAEEARRGVLANAPKPFNEQFPTWNALHGFMPAIVGAATMAPYAMRGAFGASKAANAWRDAASKGMAATDAPTLAASNSLAQSFSQQFPKPGIGNSLAPYAVPMTIGAIEGAGVANMPEAYNAFLPPENPEVKAYKEYLKQLPPGHPGRAKAEQILATLPQTMPARDAAFKHFGSTDVLSRMGVGAIEGAAGAAFGTTLAKPFYPSEKGLPRAQTQALSDRVAGRGLPEASRAIEAESSAMGRVLPMPPPRQQLAAPPAQQALPSPTTGPVQTPPFQPSANVTPMQPRPISGFDAGTASAVGLAAAAPQDAFTQELDAVRQLLQSYFQGQ